MIVEVPNLDWTDLQSEFSGKKARFLLHLTILFFSNRLLKQTFNFGI